MFNVIEQSRRCMDCGVPFCQGETGCPVQNQIPDWNRLTSENQPHVALERLHETNNFPEFTGTLCPAPCEDVCVMGVVENPVTIKNIESSLIEWGFAEGLVKPRPANFTTGRRIAIVGSGPAGLAAAQQLARCGHDVTVFEKHDRLGGLLRYGIPDFKMAKNVIDRRLGQLVAEGVRFKTNSALGEKFTLDELLREFDSVGLALGAEEPRNLFVPGRELSGIEFAMPYLVAQNRASSQGLPVPEHLFAKGKNVVIVGGGDTGADCVGTALRQGAKSVLQIELRPEPIRSKSAIVQNEGGARLWGFQTDHFEGLTSVERLIGHDVLSGSSRTLNVDLVLLAMGFTGLSKAARGAVMPLQLDREGRIACDGKMRTSLERVYASGDARRGASLIVWAIAEGRRMAEAIDSDLKENRWQN